MSPPLNWIRSWFRRGPRAETVHPPARFRGAKTHIVILDGTMSTLDDGDETNAGLAYKLLRETARANGYLVHYEAGIQFRAWRDALDVIEGRGINRQIERVYGWLASHYHDGDRIFLFGYSRGAYAARALAGMIGEVGLIRDDLATSRAVTQAYRHYRSGGDTVAARIFTRTHCHKPVPIEMIAAWDTVKALGIRLPMLWRLSKVAHDFHNLKVGNHVKSARHALAVDETRDAFAPVMWHSSEGSSVDLVQMWFRGTHGDVGGQLGGYAKARPLANVSLVWMLAEAEAQGLVLPEGWRDRYEQNARAPSVGTLAGWGKLFWFRHRRRVGLDPSEKVHETAIARVEALRRWNRWRFRRRT